MKYYGDIDPRVLFAKDDPARKFFEMAFGMKFDSTYDTSWAKKNESMIWGIDSDSFSKKAEWEEYKAKIPYTEFKELNK